MRCQRPIMPLWAIAALLFVFLFNAALAAGTKPPVPAGTDPGGVKIAIIGAGVDYTQPGIAVRLARDGEGEIIGWDFIDDDRRPFASGRVDTSQILLSEGQSASLVVIRTNFAFPVTIAKALRYADGANGEIAKGSNWGAHTIDLAIGTTSHLLEMGSGNGAGGGSPSQVALARLAALAARLVAVAPDLDGAALKRRICSLARPVSGAKPSTKAGVIVDPWKAYWLE